MHKNTRMASSAQVYFLLDSQKLKYMVLIKIQQTDAIIFFTYLWVVCQKGLVQKSILMVNAAHENILKVN